MEFEKLFMQNKINDIDDDALKNTNKNYKKKLIIAITCIVVIIVLLAVIVEMIEYFNAKKTSEPFEIDYDFYPADYEENIFEDERYLELISGEYIRFCDSSTNVTVGIDTENTGDYSAELLFMLGYIDNIINGDHKSYNARFSDVYYDTHKPLERFTMQKVYDVLITQNLTESVTDKKTGINYTKYSFALEYKIYENNGTFRRDIGNGSKKQYITVTDRNGALLIDSIVTEIIKN